VTVLCGRMQAHQMEQVKTENGRLEAAISKERFGHAKVEQECEKLQAQVTQLEAREKEVDAAIRDASAEVTQLTAVVAEAEKVGGGCLQSSFLQSSEAADDLWVGHPVK
jgi:chromosome segregation ATPase